MRGTWEGRKKGKRWKAAEKTRFWQNLEHWGSCAYPRSLIRAKFGVQCYTHSVLFLAKFCFDRYNLSQIRVVWPNFKIYGQLLYPPRSPIRTEVGVRDTHGLHAYMSNFIRIGLLRRPWRAKPQNSTAFSTSIFCGGATRRQGTNLNACAQVHTFPYQTVSKAFPYWNVLMSKSLAPILPLESDVEKKQKMHWIFRPRRRAKFELHNIQHCVKGVRTILAPLKHFSPLSVAEN